MFEWPRWIYELFPALWFALGLYSATLEYGKFSALVLLLVAFWIACARYQYRKNRIWGRRYE